MSSLRDLPPALRKALTLSDGSLESLALELGYHGGRSGRVLEHALKNVNELDDLQEAFAFEQELTTVRDAFSKAGLDAHYSDDMEAAAPEIAADRAKLELYESLHEEIDEKLNEFNAKIAEADGASPEEEEAKVLRALLQRCLDFAAAIKDGKDPAKDEADAEIAAREEKRAAFVAERTALVVARLTVYRAPHEVRVRAIELAKSKGCAPQTEDEIERDAKALIKQARESLKS